MKFQRRYSYAINSYFKYYIFKRAVNIDDERWISWKNDNDTNDIRSSKPKSDNFYHFFVMYDMRILYHCPNRQDPGFFTHERYLDT
jgi:hypothetical protein